MSSIPANLTTLVLLGASLSYAADGSFKDLGPQITSLTLQGSTFAKDPAGRDLVCTVIRGEPAKLLVFDVRSGELLHRLSLEAAHGAWNATTATDGSVYIGTDDNGHLYRWTPGQPTIEDLGQVAKDQTFAWEATAGADGEVFIGSYPGCQAIRYHPKDGFTDIGKGAVAPGENYARGLVYEPGTKKVFVGVGAHAHLIEVDPKTGEKKNILPAQYADRKFVYSVCASGGKIFALVTDDQICLVMDPATHALDAVIPSAGGQLVVSQPSPHDPSKVYVKGMGKLIEYDLKTHKFADTSVTGVPAINATKWMKFDEPEFPGESLVLMLQRGRLARFNPKTGKIATTDLKPPPEATPIQSIVCGPDGKIYSGGYLSGGLSCYDPTADKHTQLGHISQPESMGVFDQKIFMGLYPRARLIEFDTTKPFNPSKQNPRQFEELDRFDQDRPFATLGIEKLNKVYYGTVPDYGVLGGTLTIYDVATGKIDVRRNIVEDQGVVTLVYAHDLIVGGTTRSGGLGIEPQAHEAKLFLFDPAKDEKIFETTVLPKTWAITGLCVDKDGIVWGFADQKLFAFDVIKREVLYSADTFPEDESARHARWRNGMLALHPSGVLYGTISNHLFRFDPMTKEMTTLRDHDAGLIAIDPAGRVYFRDRTNLWQFTP